MSADSISLTPSSSNSLSLTLKVLDQPGLLTALLQVIDSHGGSLTKLEFHEQDFEGGRRVEIVFDAASPDQATEIVGAVRLLAGITLERVIDCTFELHRGGKIMVVAKQDLKTVADLAMAYTPGVGRVSMAIAQHPKSVYDYTIKGNTIGIVTDGSAVLGLGNIGAEAALPVMEGKSALFKKFANVDAFPICLATQDVEEIIQTVLYLAPVFGGFNLEDISAPRCFEIETRLKKALALPVFHDDQHGTAIVVLAALLNALNVVNKALPTAKIVLNGAGAAGIAVINLLTLAGARSIVACDRTGIISQDRPDLTPEKAAIAVPEKGTLADALTDADVFIGLSSAKALTVEMVQKMAASSIVFALANPIPEIQPELVRDLVTVMATGRSDYANQINNVLAFPGVFRGALDCRARSISAEMCLAAAYAIAELTPASALTPRHIIPSVFDSRVAPAVAAAVMASARATGIAQS